MSPTTKILLLITFLDSLSIGLLVPVLSPHLMSDGATNTLLGVLAAGTFSFQSISYIFLSTVQQVYGKKSALLVALCSFLISYTILIFSQSFWTAFISRLLFAFTNRAEVISKELAIENDSIVGGIFDITSIAGVVVGPIFGGYIYSFTESAFQHSVLAFCITVINIFLLAYVKELRKPQEEKCNHLENHLVATVNKTKELSNIDRKIHWHFLLLKLTYFICHTIFFTKYSFLINAHFELNIVLTSFTISYQNILVFIAHFFSPILKMKLLEKFPKVYCFEISLFIFSSCLLLLFYAPSFDWYLFFFIPMIFSYTMVDCLWDDVFNEKINSESSAIKAIVGICAPIIFGFMADLWLDGAFRIFTLMPVVLSIYMIRRRVVHTDEIKQD